jgi:hypothetical protein
VPDFFQAADEDGSQFYDHFKAQKVLSGNIACVFIITHSEAVEDSRLANMKDRGKVRPCLQELWYLC